MPGTSAGRVTPPAAGSGSVSNYRPGAALTLDFGGVSVCDRATSGSIVQQRLESKQDGALQEHGVKMRDDRRQQHPKRTTPRMLGGQCKGG